MDWVVVQRWLPYHRIAPGNEFVVVAIELVVGVAGPLHCGLQRDFGLRLWLLSELEWPVEVGDSGAGRVVEQWLLLRVGMGRSPIRRELASIGAASADISIQQGRVDRSFR